MKVPIKRWVDDPALPIHSRFKVLVDHHKEETGWLISELERISVGVLSMISQRDDGSDDFTDADALAGIRDMLSSTPPRIPERSVSPDVEFARKVLSGPAMIAARNAAALFVPDAQIESIIRAALAAALEDRPLDVPELMGGMLPMDDESPDAHAWRLACGTAQAGYERKCAELESFKLRIERRGMLDLLTARQQQLAAAKRNKPTQPARATFAVTASPAPRADDCPVPEATIRLWERPGYYDETVRVLAWLIRREKSRGGIR